MKKFVFQHSPHLSKEWDFSKNSFDPNLVSFASHKEIWWKCDRNHSWQAKVYNRTKNKSGCPYCSGRKATKENNITRHTIFEEWHHSKNDFDPKTISVHSNEKFWWKCCVCFYEWQAVVGNRTNKKRPSKCPSCVGEVLNNKNSLSSFFVSKEYSSKNKKPVSSIFRGSIQKVLWECSKCSFEWETSPNHRTRLVEPTGCPKCSNGTFSKGERELSDWIRSNVTPNIVLNSKTILDNRFEIDIYLPDFKLGIEFNGLYYHSSLFKDKHYHNNKMIECSKKGITLLQFYEDEWRDKKSIVKSIILSKTGMNEKVFLDQCLSFECDRRQINEFFEQNHLFGSCYFDKCISLIRNEELVYCLAMKENEIVRFGSKLNYEVVDGFSFCLKQIESFDKVFVWNDLRLSNDVLEEGQFIEVGREMKVQSTDFHKRIDGILENLPQIYGCECVFYEKSI